MMTFYSLDLVNHTQEVQQTFLLKWSQENSLYLIFSKKYKKKSEVMLQVFYFFISNIFIYNGIPTLIVLKR